ncbi:MAG: dienelactone hydrolase family protein [Acidobacteria bacterium]|nr:dienelactone hydrolase family protein [Acidobacteriota bacterium]
MNTETLSLGAINGTTTAFVAAPDNRNENTKAVILIHEWWGLNDNIKNIAGRYADEGFLAIAPDLYHGKIAANPDEAGKMMANLPVESGLETIKSAISAVRQSFGNSHFGITGFCMGGTYALRAACEVEGISAAAPFYGDIPPEEILRKLRVPVVFISGTKDAWINPEKVAELESAAEKYGLDIDSIAYEADHAFFNNTRPEVFDKDAADDAWAKVIGFFNDKL